MRQDHLLPTYAQLFGALDFRAVDEGRSVYSPAAYLADLLKLIEDNFDGEPLTGPDRRPDLTAIPLDGEHTYTESPYLDIVTRVLRGLTGADLKDVRFPFSMPFDLDREKARRYLRHFQTGPIELYELFADVVDRDTVAREFLGLSVDDVKLVTTVITDNADLLTTYYGFDGTFADLQDVAQFVRATRLTAVELDALVHLGATAFVNQSPTPVTLDEAGTKLTQGGKAVPQAWFERVSRFVRLARKAGLALGDADIVLRRCCGNKINAEALRTLAVVIHLSRTLTLPIDVITSLTGPIDDDLFERVFNEPFATEHTVIQGPATKVPAGTTVLTISGDILHPRNKDYRVRVARSIGLSDPDLGTVVTRIRKRYTGLGTQPGPFDPAGLKSVALLHRVAKLTTALGISATEFFTILDALTQDPGTFAGGLLEVEPGTQDLYRMLEAPDVASALCLAQLLVSVVRWMQAIGMDSGELSSILAGDNAAEDVSEQLGEALDQVALAPGSFVSDRFGERASRVVFDVLNASEGVVSERDSRLLRLDPALVGTAAYDCIAELGMLTEEDFFGLGLAEQLAGKIYTNLVRVGALDESGMVVKDDFVLAGDFTAYRARLFELIGESEAFYPSSMADLEGPTELQLAELYDNLIVLGYLDEDGVIQDPDFFADPGNEHLFTTTLPLDPVAQEVRSLLLERTEQWRTEPVTLDPEIFADLTLTGQQRTDLVESLRFNGYIDRDDNYADPAALIKLTLEAFSVSAVFHPYRAGILAAIQTQLTDRRAEVLTVEADQFAEIADHAVARAVVAALDGSYLVESLVPDEMRSFFADPANVVSLAGSVWENLFSDTDLATITQRIAAVLTEQQPYRLDLDAVADLGFDADESERLVAILEARDDIDEELAVPEDRLAWFATAANAVGYTIEGLTDYQTDIFFLLHTAAREMIAARTEITDKLTELAGAQRSALLGVLTDATGLPEGTVEAVCSGVADSLAGAFDGLLSPDAKKIYDRVRRFAVLATKLSMDATQVGVAFHDQDLADKFPEPLVLPPDVDRIDALLDSADGNRYLFHNGLYWVYGKGVETATGPKQLIELSPRFADLAAIDAAFVDAQGTEWIIGHDGAGSHAFVRLPGTGHWARKDQIWGTVRNNVAEPARIDSAFVDDDGRTYLFCGDQYVRYSGSDYTYVDEGYPRAIGEWWEGEGRHAPLPERFRTAVDASVQDRDGTTHLFSGDRCLAVGTGSPDQPTAEVWGRVRNVLGDTGKVEAAYAEPSAVVLFSGNQVARYSDSIENDGVQIDDSYPCKIESYLPDIPPGFDSALEAAFADENGIVHVFKDGKTVAVERGKTGTVTQTSQRWGQLGPILPDGVDSALVGLDGRTYLFSGERYLRYTGTDYSIVDLGYPRRIAKDWGGLRQVGASFVMDGATHLFGPGGLLFALTIDHEPDLAAGTVSRALREKLADHAITLAVDARVTGATPEWQLTADQGLKLVLRRVEETVADVVQVRIEVHVDPTQDVQFVVRYSSRDYTTPDAGYPRPLADNWWNLPDGVFSTVDTVFTGLDHRTYLFSGGHFVVFDAKHRWWSEPRELQSRWDSLPFDHVDAAFVGKDGKTYLFSGDQYVRYSGSDYTELDDRYPAPIAPFWGNIVNTITRHGRVDATLVVDTATYLFSGNQYVRYDGPDRTVVADGYPKALSALSSEPHFANLTETLTKVDAAFADRRNIYLISDGRCHAISDKLYRKYENFGDVRCAFVEDGMVLAEGYEGWQHLSSLEGLTVDRTGFRPRVLRKVPPAFQRELDAVLRGTDGNTYLFKGSSCFDVGLNRRFEFAEDWGRGRTAIVQDNRVDAAFVGRDSKTYVFSGDQFVVYAGTQLVDGYIEGEPRLIADHWGGGLTSVTLAYVRGNTTYVFEKPGDDGTMRYLTFDGTDYRHPDDGYPWVADADFWDIPADLRPDGFTAPDAVLFDGESMLVLVGDKYLARNEIRGTWAPPRPASRLWPGVEKDWPAPVTAAFTGRDSATYLFFPGKFTRVASGVVEASRPIRDVWARSRNNFTAPGGQVDAAVVICGQLTYLFSGDQYVRYTGSNYRYADPGYPRLIADNLRREDAFRNLPDSFEDVVAACADRGGRVVDAVVSNRRNVYLFINGECHAVSRAPSASYDLTELGKVRNMLAATGHVDAGLAGNGSMFLFSGDQYVRYSGSEYTFVDDGYPRTIETFLANDLGIDYLPAELNDGIDAAFHGTDNGTYLFAGPSWFRVDKQGSAQPVKGVWGRVRNAFIDTPGVDAAFVAPTGELYVFRGGQFARYCGADRTYVDDGFPRTVKDDWGDLPTLFEDGIDSAFVLDGRTYFGLGNDFVRYSDGYGQIDRTFPQTFEQRWSGGTPYRIADLRIIARFAALAGANEGLAEFSATTVPDPYASLSEIFGWDVEELRWLARHRSVLTVADDRVELELLVKLVDAFAIADRLGTGPSAVFGIWTGLFGDHPSEKDTAKALYELLARRFSAPDWAVLSRQVHDELVVLERDALASYILASTGAETSRELFERLLIDVDMGSQGMTSPVREGIAATQLFLHRYFLDLEDVTGRGGTEAEVRDRMRAWWAWMRNYRTWEANRKVFLYPENYLRPELRPGKTPAFQQLQDDLLQGEITPESVERSYKRYLDEYTEVSRLAIAGGHIYTAGAEDTRDLVLFGRTRTQPRRYYYRRAQFRSADKLTAAWEPWLKVDVQIDADLVYPVHAFNRVFVFWTTKESVAPATTGSTTITTTQSGNSQDLTAPPQTERVRIHYSFYNLNKEWVPKQTLEMDTRNDGSIYDVRLSVEAAGGGDVPESIVVSCTYSVVSIKPGTVVVTKVTKNQISALTPELVEVPIQAAIPASNLPDASGADLVKDVLAQGELVTDPASSPKVVRFTSPSKSDYGPWFSIDYKGGSFLCRPAVVAPATPVTPSPLTGNKAGLPEWSRINAAAELTDGSRIFFGNTGQYATITKGATGEGGTIADRWGRKATNLTRTGVVDAVLRRGDQTFVCSGSQYYKYTGGPFGTLQPNYPKDIETNPDNLPHWPKIDAAFTDLNEVEWFYSAAQNQIVRSGRLTTPATLFDRPGNTRFDAGFVDTDEQSTYLFVDGNYIKFYGRDLSRFDDPRPIAGNDDNIPQWSRIGAALRVGRVTYYFNEDSQTYIESTAAEPDKTPPQQDRDRDRGPNPPRKPKPRATEVTKQTRDLNRGVTTGGFKSVDAAYVQDKYLYLTSGTQYVRYTLPDKGPVPNVVDDAYPKTMLRALTGVFRRGPQRFAFSGDYYARLRDGQELSDLNGFALIQGNWGDLPADFADYTGLLDSDSDKRLYLFLGPNYVGFSTTISVPRPFERASLPLEIVRLTTSTAAQLNQRLLAGGVNSLLDPAGQELNELPAFSVGRSDRNTIQVRGDRVPENRLPAGEHLDFQSANGVYYWEIFFHAPILIAQTLNDAQRFADARQWYEYVFDPTEPDRYWKFLPFLAVDLAALADRCRRDLTDLTARLADASYAMPAGLSDGLNAVLNGLTQLTPAFRENRPLTEAELAVLDSLSATGLNTLLTDAVTAAQAQITNRIREPRRTLLRGIVTALSQLRERTALVSGLRRTYDLVGDHDSLIAAYHKDPFDPQAIADLRPVAHRRAVVMAYIDNILDWGDMLFRQYTGESIDEARMLYIFAWDLLGLRPELTGSVPLALTKTYHELDPGPKDLDLVAELTAGGRLLEGPGVVNAGVASSYFRIPDNSQFTAYWDRVEDRLRKIRQSLNILGISQPLPLFEPPIDPMDLVRAVAAGMDVGQAVASSVAVAVPHYRFDTMFRRAQELVDKLKQFGQDLLSVLERRDGEELSLLQNRQEGVILDMTRAIKDAQIEAAAANLRELQASKDATDQRIARYQRLVDNGLSALEQAQLGLMGTAAALHLTSGLLKLGAGIAYAVPQVKMGVFIMGMEWGGKQVGKVLDKAAEIPQSLAEGLQVTGELLGVRAEHDRTAEEWQFQLATAKNDLTQITHQVTGAEQQLKSAQREAEVLAQEIANNQAVAAQLKGKFSSAELYRWMAGELAGLYFQAYSMAYDTARAAERALRFERGLNDAEVTFIRPLYWDSRRGGLLAGDSLSLDLEKLGQAYYTTGARGMEITKQVSLLEIDPAAALTLSATGACDFALTEELFDHDFPGHYRRQIRSLAVSFVDEDGAATQPNATLTQMSHKTVLSADTKAVRHLLDPKQPPPGTLRSDWRANQQIALSSVGEQENNGLFELRYDDTRYLPFEGTGAVSTWHLQLTGRKPTNLRDVVITVRYTAEDGGQVFANAVKGMLKPYAAARFFDIATEFPDEWQEFVDGEGTSLTLPFTPDMFPGLARNEISGVYAHYTLANGTPVRVSLDGARLTEGKLLSTSDLRFTDEGWTFAVDGDKTALAGLGLVLTYQASVG
ncbi:hemopexin repeat-containing protein [Actinocrispum sp. NPDC049592]|uniref:Tc toxin subunit A-related protein n=1 Tax=Actinocrispum sp. NPDC049592 TaxID=3154835 RepID=UPI003422D8A4